MRNQGLPHSLLKDKKMAKKPTIIYDPKPESITLFMTEGGSDKTYQAQLVQEGEGWVINFQFGPRGGTLRPGTKTKGPIDFQLAKVEYDKLVSSKTKKGYTEDSSGSVYAGTKKAGELTQYRPKLLNAISEEDALNLIDTWSSVYAQIKHDGERRGVLRMNEDFVGANRSGLAVGMREEIAIPAYQAALDNDAIFDGEDMGGSLVVFDMLAWKGESLTNLSFEERIPYLQDLQTYLFDHDIDTIQVDIPVKMKTREDIAALIAHTKSNKEEGVVFLNGDAPYTAGRPNSGGNALKLKYVKSATVRVQSISTTKRSASMEVLDENGTWIGVGSVTILPNFEIPQPGALIEVQYLNARKGGSLFQPVYKGERTDISESSASIFQLEYKKE